MNKLILFLFTSLLLSCGVVSLRPKESAQNVTDSIEIPDSVFAYIDSVTGLDKLIKEDTVMDDGPYSMRYIVVVDSGYDYKALEKKGKEVAALVGTKFIPLHKYDKENGLYDDADFFYYSRRQTGEDIKEEELSIELKSEYGFTRLTGDPPEPSKCMILVAVFINETEAAEFLKKIHINEPAAFLKPVKMFIGCRS